MTKRSVLIVALLIAITGCTIAAFLQGEGNYLLGVLAAVGAWCLLGLALMMRWTISLQFWGLSVTGSEVSGASRRQATAPAAP